ncbi:hypothetical protein H0H87_008933 [Tephrocybe sp. NHM501043]|nr:hypothetical protein H0H87_008933 [Tephrocybe sp. NHM501043]
MALPSSYVVRIAPKPKMGGIVRPSAAHLSLSLVESQSLPSNDSEEAILLTLATSQWTISAAPKSSASMYSQTSYIASPPFFSDTKVDRRRFGIAMWTPAQDGPWALLAQLRTPCSDGFVLDLKSAAVAVSVNPLIGEDELMKEQVVDERTVKLAIEEESRDMALEVIQGSKEMSTAKTRKLRMSTKVLSKMFSRLSVHQPTSRGANTNAAPPLPALLPPPTLVSPPDSDLMMPPLTPLDDPFAKNDFCAFMFEKNADISRYKDANISHYRSTWKPHCQPSPLPETLRSHKKHKSDGSALSHVVNTRSPLPPLPIRTQIYSTI